MRHICRRTAHVKANHFVMPCAFGRAGHAHNAARRAAQNSILACKGMRIGQSARRLHEHQLHPWHFVGHLIDIPTQNGREVRIHHGGVTTADKLHERTGLVRGANL